MDLPQVLLNHLILGFHLPLRDDIPQDQRAGFEHMQGGGFLHVPAEIPAQLAGNQVHQFFFRISMQGRHLLSSDSGRIVLGSA